MLRLSRKRVHRTFAEEKSETWRGEEEQERGKDCERKEALALCIPPKSSDFSSYSLLSEQHISAAPFHMRLF